MSSRILVVEDEAAVRRGLVDLLTAQGHTVLEAETGPEGLVKAREGRPDLVILDVMLPGLDGFGVLAAMRAQKIDTPVLMLTARGAELDKVTGFALGVDDYVTKPFSMLELLGRVGALLRRRAPRAPSGSVHVGDVVVNLHQRTVTRAGTPVDVPPKAFALLAALAQANGAPVSRDALLDAVWGTGAMGHPRTVDNLVVKLRQALEADPANPLHLVTVHGEGYALRGGVTV